MFYFGNKFTKIDTVAGTANLRLPRIGLPTKKNERSFSFAANKQNLALSV
jgi:hypothetical protein